jgi:pimeloyl-ACP methyl ester carboxylesterase/CRP-like cAMP-binding protein
MSVYHINGQEVHYVEEGSPNRQKAILIHGWSSSSYAMSPISGLLSQRFHCLSVDLPGYGNSPPFEGRITIPRYAELIADLIEEISPGPVVLIGHSMGGMISTTVAIEHPVLVERMVLISPTITGKLSKTINRVVSPINMIERFALGSLIVSSVERLYVGITDRLMRPVSFSDRTDITEEEYVRLRADARRSGQGRVRAECFFAMRDHDLSGRLYGIDIPTLVLWGAEDNTVPLRDAGIVEDEWPATDLRILPKAGHWPHFESADVTRRLVAATLGLPLLSHHLHTPVDDEEIARIEEVAQFLAHSSIGKDLNKSQRTRLAAQLRSYKFDPGEQIISQNETGEEMFIVQGGTVEVWTDPNNPAEEDSQPRRVATMIAGEMTGELGMLDQGLRTADLVAGPDGATVLGLNRKMLLALVEDDPELGSKVLWNISKAMSGKVRFILWQLERALQRNLPRKDRFASLQ